MAKRGTVVPHPYPAPGGAHGRTGTCREVGESQGGARGGLTRRRFDWQGAPSPAPPGLSVEPDKPPVTISLVRILTISLGFP